MVSWAIGGVGASHRGLGRGSQGRWCPQVPENFCRFNIEVTFHTELESQNKKSDSQEHVFVADSHFNLCFHLQFLKGA